MMHASMEERVRTNRSYRRFDAGHKIETATVKALVNLARQTASAGNLQPLKYILSTDDTRNQEIFSCLAWAAYLTEWKGPGPHERPTGYVVILGDKTITTNFRCDHGIAAQTLLLGAAENGLGGCILAAINHKKLRQLLDIGADLEVLLVIALGKPVETVVLEPMPDDGSVRYWRDDNGVHHVPKRSLDDIIVGIH